MSKLSFAALREANASRAPRWHTSEAGMMEWTIGDWFMAMAGEVGEGADELLPLMFMAFVGKLGQLGNMAKKYRRVQEGIANKSDDPERHIHAENAISKMFDEIADVQIYLDLFALRLREALNTDEDIGDHVERVFNRTSEKYGFPERLINGAFMLVTPNGDIVHPSIRPEVLDAMHKEKYGDSPWPDTLARYASGAPFSEQPFNERHLADMRVIRQLEHGRVTLNAGREIGMHLDGEGVLIPDRPAPSISRVAEGEVLIEHYNAPDFLQPGIADQPYVVHSVKVGDDNGVREYRLKEPLILETGEEYKFGIRDGQPLVFKIPPIPTVWHDGCGKCEHCAMDMDMDPFCTHPEIRAQGWPSGLDIRPAVKNYCGKDGKLSLFEPRRRPCSLRKCPQPEVCTRENRCTASGPILPGERS